MCVCVCVYTNPNVYQCTEARAIFFISVERALSSRANGDSIVIVALVVARTVAGAVAVCVFVFRYTGDCTGCESSQCFGGFVALCLSCWASLVMLSHARAATHAHRLANAGAGKGGSGEYRRVAVGLEKQWKNEEQE